MKPSPGLCLGWHLPSARLGRLEVDSACAKDLRRAQGRHYADRMSIIVWNHVAPLSPKVTRLKARGFHHP
jgi:hypothetical protein